jgi:hypothetical protein
VRSARSAAAVALLLVAAALAAPAAAQTGSDSTAAPADTTEKRDLLSTDGAVSVYEELKPGEGIDGFWWEYDPTADLERLLDRDRQGLPLEPLRDGFGFELVIPDTIRALRDSVSAVADSILAERIDIAVTFDPKVTSTYTESKDRYLLSNDFATDYQLVTDGALNVKITDNREYNESTKKVQDGRRVTTAFNYAFDPRLVSTLRVSWSDDIQATGGVTDSESDHVTAGATLRKTVGAGVLGTFEASGGLATSRRNYATNTLEGESRQLQPDWKTKLARDFTGGNLTLEYDGNYGSSSREERRSFSGTDSLGNVTDTTLVDEAEETNYGNTLRAGLYRNWAEGTDLRFTGSYGRDQFQYLSQVDSLLGRKESRTRDLSDAVLTGNAKPTANLDLKAVAEFHLEETDFELDDGKTRGTTRRVAGLDLTYRAWEGGQWIFKMERSAERRDLKTNQAGDVVREKGSVDFKQAITERVELQAVYFATLDRYEFDEARSSNERDLRTQRGTFDVRYTPSTALNSAVRMEVRKTDSINLFPPQSGDNDTEHGFTITPNYTWTIGKASLRGDFTADARYKVQDYREDDNTLNRRFALRQSWQHAFTERLSTETQLHWEFNDQGTYNRDPDDGIRRFARSRETRRTSLEQKVAYLLRKGFRARVEYKRDVDRQYLVSEGERTLTSELPRHEFLYSLSYVRNLLEHLRVDVKFTQTLRGGEAVSPVDRSFYNVNAQITYAPFHVPTKEEEAQE